MESLHGVLMHGDEEVGDAHKREHKQMQNKNEKHAVPSSVKVRTIRQDTVNNESENL